MISLKPRPNFAQTSLKPRSNLAQTLLKPRSNLAQTSLKPRSNLAQISLKPSSNLAQTSLKPRSYFAQTLLKPCSNLAHISLKPCSNLAQILLKPHSNLAQTSLKCSESNAPNRRFESTLRINASNQGSANKCHSLYSLDIGIGTIGIVISLYEKCHIGILSVSADKKIEFIGIGRYEKKLIGRTLGLKRAARGLRTAACKVGVRFERGLSEV
jgi:hypothetical protein